MIDIVDRLDFDAARCEATFSKGVAQNIEEAAGEIKRLRSVLLAIMQLDGRNDLPDAWTLARAALEPRS